MERPWDERGDSPSPWTVDDVDERVVIRDAAGGFIAEATDGFHNDDDEWIMADKCAPIACLIAAAPELLEVARLLSLATDEGDDAAQGTHYVAKDGRIKCKGSFLDLIEKARAALAKATGAAQ